MRGCASRRRCNAPGVTLADQADYERALQRMRAYIGLSFEKGYLNRKHQINPAASTILRAD